MMFDEKMKRLITWANGGKAFPLSIELSPTLKCNLDCLFCWRYGRKRIDSEELSLEEYREIIKQASEMEVREIRIIGGGEPLFREDILEIMREIKSCGMFGYVCTNGTLFNEGVIRELVRIGWDHVKISLHGSSAEVHDRLVNRKGAFEKTLQNILLFEEWKKRLNRRKPFLEIGTVLVRENYEDVPNIARLAHRINAGYFFVEPVTAYTETGRKLKLSKDQLERFERIARETKEIVDKYGIHNNLDSFIGSRFVEKTGRMRELIEEEIKNKSKRFSSLPCYEPWYRMAIRVDGTVCPCGFFDEESRENVRKKSLKDIWFGEYFNSRRKQIFEGELPEHCEKCCVTLVVNNKLIRNELEKFKFIVQ